MEVSAAGAKGQVQRERWRVIPWKGFRKDRFRGSIGKNGRRVFNTKGKGLNFKAFQVKVSCWPPRLGVMVYAI